MRDSLLTRTARWIAILCLVALAGSWIPHAHDSAEAAPAFAEQLSSDDAHHEHSSHSGSPQEICLACRSSSEKELGRTETVRAPVFIPESVVPGGAPAVQPLRRLFAGLAPLRGPPSPFV